MAYSFLNGVTVVPGEVQDPVVSATLRTAASPLSPQVSPILALPGRHDSGTHAIPAISIPPEPPDPALPLEQPLLRSRRNRPNNLTNY